MTDESAVREALGNVVDPCSAATGANLDIVEMGLLEGVEIEGGHVTVHMRLTTPVCHMVAYFHEEIEDHVGGLAGVDSVALETDDGFEWSEEMLSPAAKEKRQRVLDGHRERYEESSGAD